MMVYADEMEPSPRRSGFNRFNPKRLSFFGSSSSSKSTPPSPSASSASSTPTTSPKIGQATARQTRPVILEPTQPRAPLPSHKRKTASSPLFLDAPVFTSPFTTPSPFTSRPLPPANLNFARRSSSEARAIAANCLKATSLALETGSGKRRKSVVDLEEATEGVKNMSARRRSSLGIIQPLAPAPRSSLVHYTPADPDLLEGSPRLTPSGHLRAPSGVRITLPLTFPSPVPASPLAERRAAFSDDGGSPILSSPLPPARPFSLSSTSPTSTTCSFRSSSTLTPRSPHSAPTRELEQEMREGPRGHRRTPSGVLINWPPVFPSRPSSTAFSPHSPRTSVGDDVEEIEEQEQEQDENQKVGLGLQNDEDVREEEEIPGFRRPAVPSLIRRVPPPSLASASPFPPPFFSSERRTASDDSFRNFSFPSMPTLFPRTPSALPPSPGARRISTCSSYESGQGSDVVKTPSTFELHAITPLGTGRTIYEANPFSAAFEVAGGLAGRTAQRV